MLVLLCLWWASVRFSLFKDLPLCNVVNTKIIVSFVKILMTTSSTIALVHHIMHQVVLMFLFILLYLRCTNRWAIYWHEHLVFTNETGEELSKKQAAQEATIRKLRAQAWTSMLCSDDTMLSSVWLIIIFFYSFVEARFVSLKKKNNVLTQRSR